MLGEEIGDYNNADLMPDILLLAASFKLPLRIDPSEIDGKKLAEIFDE